MDDEIEIFRPGTHTAMSGQRLEFSPETVAALAKGYDPAAFAAPVVVGHPKSDDPAYGWVKDLNVRDDGVVTAKLDDVAPEFAELVKAGRYKKVSASLYPPDHPNNPTPGQYYLRHVGFLGAAAPAVSGLKPVEMAGGDEDGTVTVEFGEAAMRNAGVGRGIVRILRSLRDAWIERFGKEAADAALPSNEIDWLQEDAASAAAAARQDMESSTAFSEGGVPLDSPTDPTSNKETALSQEERERLRKLEAENADLKKKTAEFAEEQAKARRAENQSFVDGLVKEGRLAPGVKDDVLAFMESLEAEEALDFAEGQKKTPLVFFRELLEKSGQVIDLAEHSAGDGDDAGGTTQSLADRQKAHFGKEDA